MTHKLQIPKDTIDSFTDHRIHEVWKYVEENASRFPVYAESRGKRNEIIATVPPELQNKIAELVGVMNAQCYDLQYACYLQGLSDGGFTLSQLCRSTRFDR